jgi:membrane protein
LGIIFLGGILSLLTILTDSVIGFVAPYIPQIFPGFNIYFIKTYNLLISIFVLGLWFAFLFKYLPDARIKWKIVWVGALITAILFSVGKIIMGYVFSLTDFRTIYGTAGSIVILLLFIYYSSQILFFGASFTRAYANFRNIHIRPNRHTIKYRLIEEIPERYDHLEK